MLKRELNEWKILRSWGGNSEIIDKFIEGQQMRIYAAQEVETDLQAERSLADRLADALTNPATYVALEALAAWKEARGE